MNTRLTIDLRDMNLMKLLQLEAVEKQKTLRDVVVGALTHYFSNKRENKALLKLAEKTFDEWDNDADSSYDKL